METTSGRKIIGANRRARHEYHILDKYEAGLVLQGTEVKALREGRVSLIEGFARFMGDELYLVNVHINPYSHPAAAAMPLCGSASCFWAGGS